MSSIGSLTLYVQHLQSPDSRQRDESARAICERIEAGLKDIVR